MNLRENASRVAVFFRTLPDAHPWIARALVAVALWLAWQLALAGVDRVKSAIVHRRITSTQEAAAGAVEDASQAIDEAQEAGVERRVEDRIRETTIKPQIERSESRLSSARARREKASQNEKDPRVDLTLSRDRLLERNCSDLAELYPGKKFAGCQ